MATDSTSSDTSQGFSRGAVVGITLGCMAGIALVVFLIMHFMWKRRQGKIPTSEVLHHGDSKSRNNRAFYNAVNRNISRIFGRPFPAFSKESPYIITHNANDLEAYASPIEMERRARETEARHVARKSSQNHENRVTGISLDHQHLPAECDIEDRHIASCPSSSSFPSPKIDAARKDWWKPPAVEAQNHFKPTSRWSTNNAPSGYTGYLAFMAGALESRAPLRAVGSLEALSTPLPPPPPPPPSRPPPPAPQPTRPPPSPPQF